MRRLHPKAKWLFFWQFLLSWILSSWLLSLMAFVVVGRLSELLPSLISLEDSIFSLAKAILLLFLGFILPSPLLAFFWATWEYNNYKYRLTDEGVKIERGIIWKKYITIPHEKIQNVDLVRGIIARILGLSDLHIQTAGYSGRMPAEGRIPGLDPRVAEGLKEDLLAKMVGVIKKQ